MKKLLILSTFFLVSAAHAQQQQQPDPAFMQRALTALQSQRNQALDLAASQEARANGLQDDLMKAQARVKELEEKTAPKSDAKK